MGSGHGKRRDIEGLRALAVTLVLLYHAQLPWFAGGFLGVDVFFVISGFLITRSLVDEASEHGTIRLGRFYARRARRLLPAAALVLLATAAAVRTLLPVTMWRDLGTDIAAAATYVVNWRLAARSIDYLAEDVVASPVQHFWSLAIEEQFYLVWPLLLLAAVVVARWRGWSLRTVMLVVLGLLVALPSLTWSVVSTDALAARAFFDTGTRMWELAAGGLVALAPGGRLAGSRVRVVLKLLALAVVVAAAVVVDATVAWPGWAALVAVAPTALLLHLGGHGEDLVERGLGVAPLQRVGAWSYSLYLWHWPPLAVLAARWGGLEIGEAVVIVALSVVPAVLSYRLVENPVRFAPQLVGGNRRSLAMGAALSLVGLVAGVAVWQSVPPVGGDQPSVVTLPEPVTADSHPLEHGYGSGPDGGPVAADDLTPVASPAPPLEGYGAAALVGDVTEEQVLAHLDTIQQVTPAPHAATSDLPRVYADGCHVPVPIDAVRVCEYGDAAGDVHVALVGDSKAGQWGDAMEVIGERHGWRLTYLLKSGCELSTATSALGEEPNSSCNSWNQQVLARLLQEPPDVLLTSQVSSHAYAEDGQDGAQLILEGMLDAYAQLEEAGTDVVVLLDNHNPGGRVYECVAREDQLRSCTFPRVEESGGRGAQLAAIARGDLDAIDLADRVCPTASCPPVVGGVLLYRQGSHLTRTYVDTLVPVLEERLLAVTSVL